MSNAEPTLDELFEDGRAIDEALIEAARDARRLHKALDNPIATWLDRRGPQSALHGAVSEKPAAPG